MIAMGAFAAQRGWVPATSGNFSCRVDESTIVLSRSGAEKGAMTEDDAIIVRLDAELPAGVSAEGPLHVARYRAEPAIAAIMHIHTVASTVLSRLDAERGMLNLRGFELQKAFEGISSHEATLKIPVFGNSQDTPGLATSIERRLQGAEVPGYLLEGHGLYAWGKTLAQARRHLEGLEFLLRCVLEERRLRS